MVAATCRYLGAADAAGLETLHLLGGSLPDTPVPLSPTLIHAYRHGGHKLPITWRRARRDQKKMIQRLTRDPDYMAYEAAYKRFVAEVVAPLCGDPSGVVFQCPPTLRIHMPGRAATIGVHCDGEKRGGGEHYPIRVLGTGVYVCICLCVCVCVCVRALPLLSRRHMCALYDECVCHHYFPFTRVLMHMHIGISLSTLLLLFSLSLSGL
jgi:hypothetical protein